MLAVKLNMLVFVGTRASCMLVFVLQSNESIKRIGIFLRAMHVSMNVHAVTECPGSD